MPCYHPLPAYRSTEINPESGKRGVTFCKHEGFDDKRLTLPCGKCIGCRIQRAQMWGVRCSHELIRSGPSAFLTLTYDEERLPKDGSLQPDDLQRFWKRLRKSLGQDRIRYFACGEYGEKTLRPHYHAVVFGYWPADRVLIPRKDRKLSLYRNDELTNLWGHGFVTFSAATKENATYVAKYTLGKYDENGKQKYPEGTAAPFLTMSRRPGLGANYARENAHALARNAGVRLRGGKLAALPRYYATVIERENPRLAMGLRGTVTRKAAELEAAARKRGLHDDPILSSKEANAIARLTSRAL